MLDFSNNEFGGSIPQGFSSCSNLVSLRAGFNNFSGGVPQDGFGLSGLEELSFPGNRLSGFIDGRITELKNLRILELYGNLFTGMIPQNIGRLSNLEVLKLHTNRLNGTVPSSLTNCTKLTTLYLRVNLMEDDFNNQSNIIGCGGFGLVYTAILADGTKLAIKKLSGDMGLMEREFKAEVEALSTAQHENLVTLLGYSTHAGFRLLIYSYMEKGSLDYWLHEKPDGASQLSWPIRLKIAQGASTYIVL